MTNFAPYNGPSLTNLEVVNELEKLQRLGWDIRDFDSIPELNQYRYLILVDDTTSIFIALYGISWEITASRGDASLQAGKATTLESFIEKLAKISESLNINLNLEKPKSSIRFKKTEPFSNKVKFLELINGRKIKNIFDPYFDTNSIQVLHSLAQLGLKFSTDLHCLTQKNKIDDDIVSDFNTEFSIHMEIKRLSSSSEHRRFIVLDDNNIIILGCSLNDINKNEAAHEEKCQEDIDFFTTEWEKNKALP